MFKLFKKNRNENKIQKEFEFIDNVLKLHNDSKIYNNNTELLAIMIKSSIKEIEKEKYPEFVVK